MSIERRVQLTLILAVFQSLWGGSSMLAQPAESFAPVHEVDGSFVREWLVLGPFSSKDLEAELLANAGGEANIRPKEGDKVTAADGREVT